MKQFTALVCTIVLTFTLCMSFARADAILIKPALLLTSQNNVMYDYNKDSAGLIYSSALPTLAPISLNLDSNMDTFAFVDVQVVSERNYFFEFSIIFNDKLQQFIAFFTRSDDSDNTDDEIGNHDFSTQASNKKCSQAN